jgi:metal-dependent HD superfamily phosphatase/phosphodiesterase
MMFKVDLVKYILSPPFCRNKKKSSEAEMCQAKNSITSITKIDTYGTLQDTTNITTSIYGKFGRPSTKIIKSTTIAIFWFYGRNGT